MSKAKDCTFEVVLPDSNRLVKLDLQHVPMVLTCQCGTDTFEQEVRGTKVVLTFPDRGDVFEAFSVCKPPDNFSRKVGRRLATNHLLARLRKRERELVMMGTHGMGYCDKAVRRVIFATLCPEYTKTKAKN